MVLGYLLTFPISSGIVYLLHVEQQKTVKSTKQDKIKKRFPNIRLKK